MIFWFCLFVFLLQKLTLILKTQIVNKKNISLAAQMIFLLFYKTGPLIPRTNNLIGLALTKILKYIQQFLLKFDFSYPLSQHVMTLLE